MGPRGARRVPLCRLWVSALQIGDTGLACCPDLCPFLSCPAGLADVTGVCRVWAHRPGAPSLQETQT